jgi:hypothetical protein
MENNEYIEKIGELTNEIIKLLALDVPIGTEIFLSERTLQHIKEQHPDVVGNLRAIIIDIVAEPTAVSYRQKDRTIGFFKEHESGKQYFLDLPIRPTNKDEFFVRTLHYIETDRYEKRIKKGKIITLDKTKKT